MEERYIFTDVDGVLLNMNKVFWEGVSKVLGKKVWGANRHWDYRQEAGLSKSQEDEVWRYIWDTPLELYPAAETMLEWCWSNRVKIQAVSVRPKGPPLEAAIRDFHKLTLPSKTFETHEEKTEYVLRSRGKLLYLEDKWDTADEISRAGIDTFLIDAPYNSSKDLDVRYKRILHWELPHAVRAWWRGDKYGES